MEKKTYQKIWHGVISYDEGDCFAPFSINLSSPGVRCMSLRSLNEAKQVRDDLDAVIKAIES